MNNILLHIISIIIILVPACLWIILIISIFKRKVQKIKYVIISTLFVSLFSTVYFLWMTVFLNESLRISKTQVGIDYIGIGYTMFLIGTWVLILTIITLFIYTLLRYIKSLIVRVK